MYVTYVMLEVTATWAERMEEADKRKGGSTLSWKKIAADRVAYPMYVH